MVKDSPIICCGCAMATLKLIVDVNIAVPFFLFFNSWNQF